MKTNCGMINSVKVLSNGRQDKGKKGAPQVKFNDIAYSVSPTASGTVLGGIPITQGVTVNQRTGDTIFWKHLYINYTMAAANSDVISTARVIIFQWHPNSALVAPIVGDILQVASVYSMYDWQFSNQYHILYDMVHILSGLTTAPTSSSNQGYFGAIDLSTAILRSEFSTAAGNGSEQFYVLVISDSTVAPSPSFNAIFRVTYTES